MRKFGSMTGGAAATEFAIIAVPFFLVLLSLIEIGIMFMLDAAVHNANNDIARQIRIGEIDKDTPADELRNTFCGSAWVANCETRVNLQIEPVTNNMYTGIFNTDGSLTFGAGTGFSASIDNGLSPGDIALIRSYVAYSISSPLLGGFANLGAVRVISGANIAVLGE